MENKLFKGLPNHELLRLIATQETARLASSPLTVVWPLFSASQQQQQELHLSRPPFFIMLECNCTLETAYALKDICTDLSYNDSALEFCYPEKLRDGNLSTLAGIWCLINAVVGLSGNMMTLFAIPYAAKRKK